MEIAERFPNLLLKNDPQGTGYEGKRMIKSCHGPMGEDSDIREITRLEICPGCEWFEPYIGHTSPEV